MKVDIFTEDEAAYNASFIQKESSKVKEPTDREVGDEGTEDDEYNTSVNLDEMHKKGMRTLKILTNHLLDKEEKDEAVIDVPEPLLVLN